MFEVFTSTFCLSFTLDVNCAQMLNAILQQGAGTEAGKSRVRALYVYLGQHCLTVFTDVVGSLSHVRILWLHVRTTLIHVLLLQKEELLMNSFPVLFLWLRS